MTGPVSERPFPPTLAQLWVLHAIDDLTEALGKEPSYREIADELDYPHKARVWTICKDLHGRGWLETCLESGSHTLVLTRDPPALPEHALEITAEGAAYLQEGATP